MQHLVGRDVSVDRECSRVLIGYVLSLCAVRDIGGWMYGKVASRWGPVRGDGDGDGDGGSGHRACMREKVSSLYVCLWHFLYLSIPVEISARHEEQRLQQIKFIAVRFFPCSIVVVGVFLQKCHRSGALRG